MQSKIDVNLTTEKIKKKFKNKFDLVNYAIKMAQGQIGHEPFVLGKLLDKITQEDAHD